jgi:hypothetical protein
MLNFLDDAAGRVPVAPFPYHCGGSATFCEWLTIKCGIAHLKSQLRIYWRPNKVAPLVKDEIVLM